MKILHLLSQIEMTGSEAYAQTLASAQARSGHDLFVISDNFHLSFPGHLVKLSIATRSFFQRMKNIFKLRRFIIENKIEVIHCHSRAACRHAYWARLGLETCIVTTLHGYQHSSFSKKLFNIYGDTVIAVCENIKQQLIENFTIDPHSLITLRNPIIQKETINNSEKKTLSLIGRASGPKGQRLISLFREQLEFWLTENPEISVLLALTGLSEQEKNNLKKSIPTQLISRVQIVSEFINLQDVFKQSFCVVASGRIAIEAYFAGCEVACLGESSFVGRLEEKNIKQILASNFGDIGKPLPVSNEQISEVILLALKNPLSTSTRQALTARLSAEFSLEAIHEKIIEIYRGTRLYRKCSWIPILMYHKVTDQEIQSRHKIYVTKKRFKQHLQYLKWRNFQTITFSDLSDFWFERKSISEFPKSPLILTFDDGYQDNLTNALPLLRQYQMKAQLFLLSDHKILANTWDEPEDGVTAKLMSEEERQMLPLNIYEIGSHGQTHRELPKLNNSEILRELAESKQQLENEFKQNISCFAYPYGRLDHRLPSLAQKAGYDFAVNTDNGPVRWIDNRHSLFRVNVFPQDSLFAIWKKTSRWYRRSYFHKRGQ